VIALCAVYFQSHGTKSGIVVPNSELAIDFRDELVEVLCDDGSRPDILTIGQYASKRSQFEVALVDEAHNLQSAIELDPSVTRIIHISSDTPQYEVVSDFIPSLTDKSPRELNPQLVHDILKRLERFSNGKANIKRLLATLSRWCVFGVVSDSGYDFKFLAADPAARSLMPKGKPLLFSATPLDKEELEFYCNITAESVKIFGNSEEGFVPKPNVKYYFRKNESEAEKRSFVSSILKASSVPSLILMNNNQACVEWASFLGKEFSDRLLTIPSYLRPSVRMKIYTQFQRRVNPILLTSSSVYWEGINIKGLRLVIIPNPPFPHRSLLDIESPKRGYLRRITARRLIQGAGRVGRSSQSGGICLFLFKPQSLTKYCKEIASDNMQDLTDSLQNDQHAD
jgi:hypothetical protein